jgi:hypothetical protein|tara:strand:- start:1584 stop:1763 length:180 start_codon:yes stop_codon:yes gene_type:complete
MNLDYRIEVTQELLKSLGVRTGEDLAKARLAIKIKKLTLMGRTPELEINRLEWLRKALS